MPLIDHLLSIGKIRKALWRGWYPFLTLRSRKDPVVFLNYAYEEDPPLGLPLGPEDDRDRACLQLYHHVASQADLAGKDVLEVGCGHGGGASYVARAMKPRALVGLDLNPAGIRFCRRRHLAEGLSFREGDAEALPFPDGSFDAVINVESSHCYPDFPKFLSEAARVLRPGGRFLYADFRFKDGAPAWEAAIAGCGMEVLRRKDITREVLRGMDRNSERSTGLVEKVLPKFLWNLGRDFAGVKDSRIYDAFRKGEAVYLSFHLKKPA